MSSTIKIPAMPEPEVIDRHLPTGITLRGFTKKQLAARDAQWQEMVGPILKELKDAATSLETIGRLAGFAEYVGEDGERVQTYMKHGDEIRGYATSRASAARAGLSAITEE